MIQCKHFINGVWQDSLDSQIRNIINPYDNSVIAEAQEASGQDTLLAIEAGRTAFDSGVWSSKTSVERANLLNEIAEIISKNKAELATLETLDTGKTLVESKWDMDDIANVFKYYAKLAVDIQPETLANDVPHTSSSIRREPVGVAAMICPWNYPLLQASWKMAPAIAAGCTFILKPSELTPVCTTRFIELVSQLDIPNGVLNLVLGSGANVGSVLSSDPRVDLVSFTGGIVTGQKIMQSAAGSMKKIALELGGKNPHLIFEDAHLEIALDKALSGVFFHAGQICSAGSRILVHKNIAKEFTQALKDRMNHIKLGSGMDPETKMGPVIGGEHLHKVEQLMQAALKEGAQLECGGQRALDPELKNGFFLEPTLFSQCTANMQIVRQEVFGPVITIETFESDAEALKLANDTPYGLSAGIQTTDNARMQTFAKALRFGTVWINDFNVYFPEAPWGGYKSSGIGRELGPEGLMEYQETKHVFTNHQPEVSGWF